MRKLKKFAFFLHFLLSVSCQHVGQPLLLRSKYNLTAFDIQPIPIINTTLHEDSHWNQISGENVIIGAHSCTSSKFHVWGLIYNSNHPKYILHRTVGIFGGSADKDLLHLFPNGQTIESFLWSANEGYLAIFAIFKDEIHYVDQVMITVLQGEAVTPTLKYVVATKNNQNSTQLSLGHMLWDPNSKIFFFAWKIFDALADKYAITLNGLFPNNSTLIWSENKFVEDSLDYHPFNLMIGGGGNI
jgi:hypothetical protein